MSQKTALVAKAQGFTCIERSSSLPLSFACRRLYSLSSHCLSSMLVCVQISTSYKGTCHNRLWHYNDPISTHCLTVCKFTHIPRSWELWLQHVNFMGHSVAHKKWLHLALDSSTHIFSLSSFICYLNYLRSQNFQCFDVSFRLLWANNVEIANRYSKKKKKWNSIIAFIHESNTVTLLSCFWVVFFVCFQYEYQTKASHILGKGWCSWAVHPVQLQWSLLV